MRTILYWLRFLFVIASCCIWYEFVGAQDDQLCFPVIGDIGGMPRFPFQTTAQKKVAKLLAQTVRASKSKFVVGVGDNFYFSGVRSVHDPRFYLTFERTYSDPSLNIPWYMIAGNHDHVSNVSAQILYSTMSKRWKFPHFYYTKVFVLPNSKKSLQLVQIDTTMLCWHNKRSNSPSSQVQLEWIEKTLQNSKSSFIIVTGHHPVFSSSSHGNTECLVKILKPLLEKYAVSAYFSGHDHNLQSIKESNSDVHYFVSGSGNFADGNFRNKLKLMQEIIGWQYGDNGFLLVCVSDNHTSVSAYRTNTDIPTDPIYLTSRQQENSNKEDTTNKFKTLMSQLFPVKNDNNVSLPPSENKQATSFWNISLTKPQWGAAPTITKPKELISKILSEIQPIKRKTPILSTPPGELNPPFSMSFHRNKSAHLNANVDKMTNSKKPQTKQQTTSSDNTKLKKPHKLLDNIKQNELKWLWPMPKMSTEIPSTSYLSNIPLSSYGTLPSDSGKRLDKELSSIFKKQMSDATKTNQIQAPPSNKMEVKSKDFNKTYTRAVEYSKPFSNNTLQSLNLMTYQNIYNFYRPPSRYYTQLFYRSVYNSGTPVQPITYIPGIPIQPTIYNNYYYLNKSFRKRYS